MQAQALKLVATTDNLKTFTTWLSMLRAIWFQAPNLLSPAKCSKTSPLNDPFSVRSLKDALLLKKCVKR